MSTQAVTAQELDLSVYGQVQYSYSITGGKSGLDLGSAAAIVGCSRAVGVEKEVTVLSAGLKKRSKAIDDLSKVMIDIEAAIASAKAKATAADTVDFDKNRHMGTFQRYGVRLTDNNGNSLFESDSKIKLGNLNQLQQNVRLVSDKEDNALQRVASQLQSAISKRDNSYNQMEKFLKKFDGTAGTIIRNIGK